MSTTEPSRVRDAARRSGVRFPESPGSHSSPWEDRTDRPAPRVRRAAAHHLDAVVADVTRTGGPLGTAVRYLPAGHLTQMGGDVYDVLWCDDGALLLVADVRGKGAEAAQLARMLLSVFRAVAGYSSSDVATIAMTLDDAMARGGTAEDFATAVLVRFHAAGWVETVTCGHPAPLLVTRDGVRALRVAPAVPLGLGPRPVPVSDTFDLGDRLLMYTDGLIEARDSAGRFFPLAERADILGLSDLETALDALLGRVVWHARGAPDDDLALLLAERLR